MPGVCPEVYILYKKTVECRYFFGMIYPFYFLVPRDPFLGLLGFLLQKGSCELGWREVERKKFVSLQARTKKEDGLQAAGRYAG